VDRARAWLPDPRAAPVAGLLRVRPCESGAADEEEAGQDAMKTVDRYFHDEPHETVYKVTKVERESVYSSDVPPRYEGCEVRGVVHWLRSRPIDLEHLGSDGVLQLSSRMDADRRSGATQRQKWSRDETPERAEMFFFRTELKFVTCHSEITKAEHARLAALYRATPTSAGPVGKKR
jgi:hypothetical protein